MQKWEYAQLSYVANEGMFNPPDRYVLDVYSISNSTVFDIRQDKTRGDKALSDARKRTIAQLGLDGWELVNVSFTGIYTNNEVFYFKRALP